LKHIERFTDLVGAYVAARPSYPPESVDVLIEGMGDPASLAVADLGAGTGISSRVIAARGPLVYAIEPNAKMRAAAAPDERVKWVNGTAEATTLPDRSVDVVAAFQAWHWVEHVGGVAEARRILRPGGRMAAIYNERDERDPFTAGYGAAIMKVAIDDTEKRRADALAAFARIDLGRTQRFEYGNTHDLDRAGLHQRAESSSYLPKNNEAARGMHVELDALFERFQRNGNVTMHLVTLVVRVDVV
jgi:SAM-dependent methyltransferase